MAANPDELFGDEPRKWVLELPAYSRDPIVQLLTKGCTFDEVAELWVSATAANTFRFATSKDKPASAGFVANVKKEIREYLCGTKYKKDREALFGENSLTRSMVITAIATAIAPVVGVAVAVLVPVVAVALGSIGKITLNAWCATIPNDAAAAQK